MIIVLLLFFKSICLYCQRLVLHIHDRWINPKNVRLLKEAAEAKGQKFQIEDFRQVKKTKKRRYASSSTTSGHSSASPLSNSLVDSDSCRFCANTPQGYCRHHFHLQELHVQKQQRQQKIWCPLSGVIASSNRSTEYRQLRKIKRELKRNIQQQQQQHQHLKSAKGSAIPHKHSIHSANACNYPPSSSPPSLNTPNQSNRREYSSEFINDSGYETITVNTPSTLESVEHSDSLQQQLQADEASIVTSTYNNSPDYVDIELPSPTASFVETTYSFKTCCETPRRSPSSIHSFISNEYSAFSTSYL